MEQRDLQPETWSPLPPGDKVNRSLGQTLGTSEQRGKSPFACWPGPQQNPSSLQAGKGLFLEESWPPDCAPSTRPPHSIPEGLTKPGSPSMAPPCTRNFFHSLVKVKPSHGPLLLGMKVCHTVAPKGLLGRGRLCQSVRRSSDINRELYCVHPSPTSPRSRPLRYTAASFGGALWDLLSPELPVSPRPASLCGNLPSAFSEALLNLPRPLAASREALPFRGALGGLPGTHTVPVHQGQLGASGSLSPTARKSLEGLISHAFSQSCEQQVTTCQKTV